MTPAGINGLPPLYTDTIYIYIYIYIYPAYAPKNIVDTISPLDDAASSVVSSIMGIVHQTHGYAQTLKVHKAQNSS